MADFGSSPLQLARPVPETREPVRMSRLTHMAVLCF